jgi:hypothetical protein
MKDYLAKANMQCVQQKIPWIDKRKMLARRVINFGAPPPTRIREEHAAKGMKKQSCGRPQFRPCALNACLVSQSPRKTPPTPC